MGGLRPSLPSGPSVFPPGSFDAVEKGQILDYSRFPIRSMVICHDFLGVTSGKFGFCVSRPTLEISCCLQVDVGFVCIKTAILRFCCLAPVIVVCIRSARGLK